MKRTPFSTKQHTSPAATARWWRGLIDTRNAVQHSAIQICSRSTIQLDLFRNFQEPPSSHIEAFHLGSQNIPDKLNAVRLLLDNLSKKGAIDCIAHHIEPIGDNQRSLPGNPAMIGLDRFMRFGLRGHFKQFLSAGGRKFLIKRPAY